MFDQLGPGNRIDRQDGVDPNPFAHSVELQALIARLKHERIRRGWSQGHVARLTDQARSAISRLENGQYHNPTFDTVYRYALRWACTSC